MKNAKVITLTQDSKLHPAGFYLYSNKCVNLGSVHSVGILCVVGL